MFGNPCRKGFLGFDANFRFLFTAERAFVKEQRKDATECVKSSHHTGSNRLQVR